MEIKAKVNEKAKIEVINFENKSWIRWYLPDWSDNGNIDLPDGSYKIKERIADTVTLEKI